MGNRAKRHTHKYYHTRLPFGKVWACALDDCNHYMPPHMEALLPGKATLCWKCEETTHLDSRTLAMDKPLCIDCDELAIKVTDNSRDLEVKTIAEMIGRINSKSEDE